MLNSATCTKMRGGLTLGDDLHTCVSSLDKCAGYVSFNEYRNAYIHPADIKNHFQDMDTYSLMQTRFMVFVPRDAAQRNIAYQRTTPVSQFRFRILCRHSPIRRMGLSNIFQIRFHLLLLAEIMSFSMTPFHRTFKVLLKVLPQILLFLKFSIKFSLRRFPSSPSGFSNLSLLIFKILLKFSLSSC